jgi:Fanconi anemia group M protein
MRFHLDDEPLMSLYIRICAGWQIPIVHTRDGQHTAYVIKQIAHQDVRAPAGPIKPRPRNPAYAIKEPALRVVTAIPGIGAKRALALISHFGTISAILGASESELRKVPGIGLTHAASICAVNKPLKSREQSAP